MTSTVPVDPELVQVLCREATAHLTNMGYSGTGEHSVTGVLTDTLDSSIWVQLNNCEAAAPAATALTGYGLAVSATTGATLHVTGWDTRLLRARLGVLLAGIDDLSAEWESTAELATYFYDRHTPAGTEAERFEVLGEVEHVLRSSTPLPRQAPAIDEIAILLELIDTVESAYSDLIDEHVAFADLVLLLYYHHLTTSDPDTAHTAVRELARTHPRYRGQR